MDIQEYANESGYACDIMRDIQRIFACLHMENKDNEVCTEEYLAKVAQSNSTFGARVTVPMSAQAEWRQGFRRVSFLCH